MCFESAAVAIENRLMSSVQNEDLFRKQAIQSLSQKSPGRPICLVPRPWVWLTLLVVLLFLSAGVFAGSAEYSRKETVRGWLVSRTGVARVTTRSAAVVREVVRRPGDRVTEGELPVADGKKILFSTGRSGKNELWMMDADKKAQREQREAQHTKKMLELLTVRQFKESMEKLREEAKEKFIKEEEKEEQKIMDDITTYKFAQNIINQNNGLVAKLN